MVRYRTGTVTGLGGIRSGSPPEIRRSFSDYPARTITMIVPFPPGRGADITAPPVAEAKGLCDACLAGFVDARGAHEYAHGHVANAVHLPPAGHPDEAAVVAKLKTYPLVIVYDGEWSCQVADDVAARLRRAGLGDVRVLQGAWPAWASAKAPSEVGSCGVCGVEAFGK